MATDRENRVIGVLAVGIAVAFAGSGTLFAPTAQARWFFAGTVVVLVLWPLVRQPLAKLAWKGRV